jgi:hypothetical protein
MYQPELGRFLQPDPQEFGAGDYNLYRYCHNDPVNNSDPTGMEQVFGEILRDRMWDSACLADSGNSFQGSLGDFNKRLYNHDGPGGGGGGDKPSPGGHGGNTANDPKRPQSEHDFSDWRDAGLAGGNKAWAKTDHSGLGGTESFEYGGLILKHEVNGHWMYNYNGLWKGRQGSVKDQYRVMKRANYLDIKHLPVPNGWTKAGWYYSHPVRGNTIPADDKELAPDYGYKVVGFAPNANRAVTYPMIEFYPK